MSWHNWTVVELPIAKAMNVLLSRLGPKPEIKKWLGENVGQKHLFFSGESYGEWHNDLPLSDTKFMTFYFRQPDKAMLFKLTWA